MVNASIFHGLSAFLSLVIPVIYVFRNTEDRSPLFWLLMGASFLGCASWTAVQFNEQGALSLSIAIWLSITITFACFLVICLISQTAWRLSLLLMPYFALLGLIAYLWQAFPAHSIHLDTDKGFVIWVHIIFSVFTYAFATLAAIAGLSAFIVEKALKNKKPTKLSRKLPSVIDNENLLFRLLITAIFILLAGMLSGMAASLSENGHLFVLDHKTILTIASFGAISLLVWSHHRYGTRGKTATRLVLIAYLLMSLGFLGVKFVTDVLMA